MPNSPWIFSAVFVSGFAIATLAGLIGLGGAEFRLPVLIALFGCAAREAVPLNLLISLVTVAAGAFGRLSALPASHLSGLSLEMAAMIAGAMVAAWLGAGWLRRIGDASLHTVVGALLLLIAALLATEVVLPEGLTLDLPDDARLHFGLGALFGLLIGAVSSVLGVAGGELIIPTLLFVFGADIKTAGTASLLISLPTMMIGLLRYHRLGAFTERNPLVRLGAPMAGGSVVGALAGTALVGLVPANALKILLAAILAASAVHLMRASRG